MYAEIVSAVESAKVLGSLLKTANSLANYNEIVSAVAEVNSKLMSATTVALTSQEKQAQMATRIRDLEADVLTFQNWDQEIERYMLQSLPPGVLMYALRPEMANGEPPHFLCVNCANNRQKAILQVTSEGEYGRNYLCHRCSSKIHVVTGTRPRQARTDYDPLGGPESWMR